MLIQTHGYKLLVSWQTSKKTKELCDDKYALKKWMCSNWNCLVIPWLSRIFSVKTKKQSTSRCFVLINYRKSKEKLLKLDLVPSKTSISEHKYPFLNLTKKFSYVGAKIVWIFQFQSASFLIFKVWLDQKIAPVNQKDFRIRTLGEQRYFFPGEKNSY